jgi:3-hydroxy acid dehydrogenase/malonic semialdehyde reductase
MNRIEGKTVLITGATAGIGEACARAFAARGANLVIAARRETRLARLVDELTGDHNVAVRPAVLDVRNREAVMQLVEELDAAQIEVDVLVNNAGLARGIEPIQEGHFDRWDEMIDTNVKGVLAMMRAFVPGMIARNRGHVVTIGSIAGHQVYTGGNVYNATKYAVRALNEALNLDLVGTKIRVSSIDPGLVETEFSEVRFDGDRQRADKVYRGYTPLRPEDVADAVCYVVNAPQHVDILDLVILPTDQRSVHVVHKEAE